MTNETPVAFIVGGGPRIGHAVATALKAEGYAIAIASRTPDQSVCERNGWLAVPLDLNDNAAIKSAFGTVKSKLGIPNVVVYNAANLTFAQANDPFAISVEDFEKDTKLNVTAAYASLHEFSEGVKQVSDSLPKVFIATGNVVPFQPVPMAVTLGAGKSALVHLIQVGNAGYGALYGGPGPRFYWASQVGQYGEPVPFPNVDAQAHAKMYVGLVNRKTLGEWDVRFM